MIDKGRLLDRELPELWKKDIQATAVSKTTRPKVTEKGVEMLAICARSATRELDTGLTQDAFQKKAPELDKKILRRVEEAREDRPPVGFRPA